MKQTQLRRAIFVGAISFTIAGGASNLFAKRYGANTPMPKSNSNSNSNSNSSNQKPAQTPTPPADSATPTTEPTANNEVAQAEASMLAAEAKAKKKFESTPEWTAAEEAVSKAQADATTASAGVGASVRKQPEYVAAADNVTKAETKLQQARDNGADGSEIAADATELMTARSALGALQSKAAAADPTVVAAKEKLASANLAVEQLRKSETAAVQADPDYQAAKKAYDDARGKLASSAK